MRAGSGDMAGEDRGRCAEGLGQLGGIEADAPPREFFQPAEVWGEAGLGLGGCEPTGGAGRGSVTVGDLGLAGLVAQDAHGGGNRGADGRGVLSLQRGGKGRAQIGFGRGGYLGRDREAGEREPRGGERAQAHGRTRREKAYFLGSTLRVGWPAAAQALKPPALAVFTPFSARAAATVPARPPERQ